MAYYLIGRMMVDMFVSVSVIGLHSADSSSTMANKWKWTTMVALLPGLDFSYDWHMNE